MKKILLLNSMSLGLMFAVSIASANPTTQAIVAKNQQFDQRYAQWKMTQPEQKNVNQVKTSANTTVILATKVNLNTATVLELQQLTGVGEAKAKAIIAYRKKQGGFNNIEELKQVKGIGDALFQKNKARLRL